MHSRIILFITLLILTAGHLRAQENGPLWLRHADTLQLRRGDTLHLPHRFVQRDGLRVTLLTPAAREVTALVALDGPAGQLFLRPSLLADSIATVAVQYTTLPLQLPLEYRLRRLVPITDSATGGSLQVAAPSQPLNMESIFGSELQKSGYIGRGFTVGSNRDLSINSGFRLQLAGKLSEDITVTGALTDENTPIQPEGNTRTIQELDRVYINIAGNGMSATLGDFPLSYTDTEFGRYSRKLSGVLGEAASGATRAAVSYASLNGSYHSMQFNGIDGVQGPYRLTGRNGEQPILVLAGTEHVYVDGVPMTRGERNDYVIEYANGEITFTPNRLITSYSRITVDYEYAEREYVRSMITTDMETALFDERLTVGARYIREADDEGSPIDLDFSDADRDVLSAAGDDAQSASRSGVTYVGYDTARGAGAGQYLRVDSTIAGEAFSFYRYAPGSDSATYVLSFSFVGQGQGDYRRQTVGTFVFAGIGGGDYAPLRLLPLPRLHQLLDLRLRARPRNDLQLQGELGVSDLDRNRFSDRDDDDNTGAAYNLGASWKPKTRRFGDFDLSLRYRDVDARFQPVDRIKDIEFNRKWDISSPTVARERMTEGRAGWSPWRHTRIAAGAGSISRGGFSSLRLDGGLAITPAASDSGLPALDYAIEHIDSDDGASGIRGSWLRQRGTAEYRAGLLTPRLRFEQEHRESRASGTDTLRPESLSFVDVRPGVLFPSLWNMTFSADVGVRIEDALDGGTLARQSTDILQIYGWQLRPWNNLNSEISVTVRDRRYSEQFRARGRKDLQTLLTRAQTRYTPLNGGVQTDLLYEVSTERTSRLQRVFLNVPYGQGNYEYLGDLNGNGVQDEEEFELTRYEGDYVLLTLPTDELFPVIDLKTSLRLRLRPERFLPRMSTSFWTGALRALSTESFVRIEEKSEESRTSDIYLLRLSRFLDDSTTIRGYQNFRQDVFLFERAQDFSLRLRFDERRGFSQYALVSERSYRRERSLRIKTQLVREIGLQTDIILLDDEVLATAFSSRARDIVSSNLVADLSYRPWKNLEIGFVVDSKSATDSHPETPVQADITALTLRSVTSFPGPGRLRVEIERSTVTLDTEVDRAPFELTDGRVEGQSWVWRLNFDYRLTEFMQATLSYLGRAEGDRDTIHIARAEVKAFF
ncbi:MAG: hypothetical protein RRA94_07935 [Bacteroidota bacterium]|nr:hypothetical protein [Bacteroidota bacterium]